MKKFLFLIAAGIALLLASCASNGDIDNLQSQIDELKSGRIASIESQISSINTSISALQEADRETKDTYSWATYKWCEGLMTLTKYKDQGDFGIVDYKATLEPEDDAARVLLGGSWRIPTDDEWTELWTQCTWTWTNLNGVNGRLVTGLNGNTIFFPAAGERFGTDLIVAGSAGSYWSSSQSSLTDSNAGSLSLSSGEVIVCYISRCNGLSIRPVSK